MPARGTDGLPARPGGSTARREAPAADPAAAHPEVDRFITVMAILRGECPWDARQTHRSLVPYLVEEAMEAVEAIEAGDATDLREELGDLLIQVVFHAAIAAEPDGEGFDIDDVARGVADKLIGRHPYIFAGQDLPEDLDASWEARKRRLKGRTSALEGIPQQLSAVHRATKVIDRARSHRVDLAGQGVDLPTDPISAEEVGRAVLALVARAQACGVDAEQATRDALRGLEGAVRAAETGDPGGAGGPGGVGDPGGVRGPRIR